MKKRVFWLSGVKISLFEKLTYQIQRILRFLYFSSLSADFVSLFINPFLFLVNLSSHVSDSFLSFLFVS